MKFYAIAYFHCYCQGCFRPLKVAAPAINFCYPFSYRIGFLRWVVNFVVRKGRPKNPIESNLLQFISIFRICVSTPKSINFYSVYKLHLDSIFSKVTF
jgi:hypothetical protein